jgi:hypothetical protein
MGLAASLQGRKRFGGEGDGDRVTVACAVCAVCVGGVGRAGTLQPLLQPHIGELEDNKKI